MKNVTVPEDIFQKIVNVLTQLPYKDISPLIQEIQQRCDMDEEQEPEAPEDE